MAVLWFSPVFGAEVTPAGTIAGKVVSLEDGSFIASATVMIPGSGLNTTTDLNGEFRLADVPEGSHTLRVLRAGFRMSEVENVRVSAGKTAKANVPMQLWTAAPVEQTPGSAAASDSEIVELDALVIAGELVEGSGLALMGVREKAAQVSDAIGADFMGRVDAGDAAEAVGRITGASVVDGKYVLIRGLGDRYSNTLLNNVTVPSADPDRRAVQMDQFPSSVLESIVTSKSFTPDQPGAFSGGSVNMKTKSFPENFFAAFNFSVAANTEVTGKNVLSIPGGGRDWAGSDDGTRALPAGLPDAIPSRTAAQLAARNGDFAPAQELDRASKLFNNETYFPAAKKARPNFGFGFSTGDRINLGEERLFGYVVSASYKRATSHFADGYGGRFGLGSFDPESPSFVDRRLVYSPNLADTTYGPSYEENPNVPGGVPAFGVTQTADNVDWGTFVQLAYKPSSNHEVSLHFLRNQSATDRIKRGVGEATRSDAGRMFEVYDMLYTERSVDSVQLAGESLFPGLDNARVEWRLSKSRSTQEQPDYRSLSFFWDFTLQQYATASGVGNNRFFRHVVEDSDEASVDVSLPLELFGRTMNLKTGGFWQNGDRTYRERRFRWTQEANNRDLIENYPNPVGIVSQTANAVTFGNTIFELPNNLVNYDGSQEVLAGYAMADVSVAEDWRAIFGLRAEYTTMSTGPAASSTVFRAADLDQVDYLPALSLVHTLPSGANLRFAYGRTIARPLYRELADIRVEDPFNDEFFAGNPSLKMTTIDNFDLRWERFGRRDEIVAVSLFYKDFTNPIEVVNKVTSGSIQPQNLSSGTVYGVEFETRQGLGGLAEWLQNFSMGANLSLIASEASIPQAEMDAIRLTYPDAKDTRDLFGQSPYVFNFDLTYSNPDRGTTVTAAFNVVGERLTLVADAALPDVYEQPAPALDLIVSQSLGRRWKVKFAAKNLLDPDIEQSFSHNGQDYFYSRYRKGRTFTLGLSWFYE